MHRAILAFAFILDARWWGSPDPTSISTTVPITTVRAVWIGSPMTDEIRPDKPFEINARLRHGAVSMFLVAVGGALGTGVRHLLSDAINDTNGVPFGILVVNLTGALLIGVLVETLAMRVHNPDRHRQGQLLFTTGIMGGYTTYSGLALGAAELIRNGRPVAAVAYGFITVLVGALATGAGIWLARMIGHRP